VRDIKWLEVIETCPFFTPAHKKVLAFIEGHAPHILLHYVVVASEEVIFTKLVVRNSLELEVPVKVTKVAI